MFDLSIDCVGIMKTPHIYQYILKSDINFQHRGLEAEIRPHLEKLSEDPTFHAGEYFAYHHTCHVDVEDCYSEPGTNAGSTASEQPCMADFDDGDSVPYWSSDQWRELARREDTVCINKRMCLLY